MANENIIKEIEKILTEYRQGLTINQIMEYTKLSRGTVKTYLDEMVKFGRVHEENYNQNTKVFFLNGIGKYQHQIQMGKEGILFVDVMTNPWKKPFIRIKYRDKEDKGAIFVGDEEFVDKLIDALNKAKPQLKIYEEMNKKLGNILV